MATPRRRVVILGGAGFIGSHLCDHFLAQGSVVVCVDNYLTGAARNIAHLLGRPDFEHIETDISEGLAVEGDVDAVLHFASPASPADYRRFPIETLRAGSLGTFNALALSQAKNARFVLASTSEVYGDPQVHPQAEAYWGNVNPVGPRSCYDEAKRFAEALTWSYARQHQLSTCIIRIFNTFGPRMRAGDGRVIPNFIDQALSDRPLTIAGDGTQTRSFCYVDDLVDGVSKATAADIAGPVNLGNPVEHTVRELADLVRAQIVSDAAIAYYPLPQDDPQIRCPDISRARRQLGWSPAVTLAEGLRRTIEWTLTAEDSVQRESQQVPSSGRH
ncbi:UDP-glucuronic acid decarboxylase family protein [Nonomuraea sp. NPDC005650]|uniref:UDP-glucuronic acid decarboxylase family protein n=1 Tax=Nonomuraea sp. NPDC005650 TaxID=3157045 RepID=UPI0033B3CF49